MRVYYIGNEYDGCFYVRCLLPLIYNGWDGQKTSIYGVKASNERMCEGALASDIVVFQRPSDPKRVEVINLLQMAGKKVVFDNDDTYKAGAGIPTQMALYKDRQALKNINNNLDIAIQRSDLVTTTTEFLADEYRKLNKNVVVLPNCIDPEDWDEPLKNESNKVRIGMVGSVLTNEEYVPILKVLQTLHNRDDVQLVILGLPKNYAKKSLVRKAYKPELDFWSKFKKLEWHQWVEHKYYNQKLNELRLDMMLIPKNDSYFTRCKSNIKFLEASMCEIPVIAQGFKDKQSPYEVNPEDTKYLKLVSDNTKWMSVIDHLIKHPQERKQMGLEARKYVIKNYNIQTKYELWKKAYETIK